jgi:hypothetical protein
VCGPTRPRCATAAVARAGGQLDGGCLLRSAVFHGAAGGARTSADAALDSLPTARHQARAGCVFCAAPRPVSALYFLLSLACLVRRASALINQHPGVNVDGHPGSPQRGRG